jgi:zinc transporter ZupT
VCPENFIADKTALAAGAMLAMLADTMIPEAFDEARNWAGLITVMGSWWLCFDKAGWLRRPRF